MHQPKHVADQTDDAVRKGHSAYESVLKVHWTYIACDLWHEISKRESLMS